MDENKNVTTETTGATENTKTERLIGYSGAAQNNGNYTKQRNKVGKILGKECFKGRYTLCRQQSCQGCIPSAVKSRKGQT